MTIKFFREVLAFVPGLNVSARLLAMPVSRVTCDSRAVIPGSLFVARKGEVSDGRKFIAQAVEQGAALIAFEDSGDALKHFGPAEALLVKDTDEFLRQVLQRFYDDPAAAVRLIGVTGTNGKTTITYLLESIFHAAGKKNGVVGTVNYRLGEKTFPAKNTTPGLVDNFHFLAECRTQGAQYCIMEVSSHALVQGRVKGLNFAAGVFTNLTGDHLDYHKNMEQYFQAKARLFTSLPKEGAYAVINRDDAYAQQLIALTKCPVLSYGLAPGADLYAEDIYLTLTGSAFLVSGRGSRFSIETELIGKHNIYNILAAIAVALRENISPADIQEGIRSLHSVPGRLQRVTAGQNFHVFIDYAHTHDALENVLMILRQLNEGRLIVVFGCGGDRDKTKRPKMGDIASRLADYTIVTSDNPRSEDPDEIIQQIIAAMGNCNYKIIKDRKAAIAEALKTASAKDIVLIAGKGHENYQIFRDQTIPFDEEAIVRELLGQK